MHSRALRSGGAQLTPRARGARARSHQAPRGGPAGASGARLRAALAADRRAACSRRGWRSGPCGPARGSVGAGGARDARGAGRQALAQRLRREDAGALPLPHSTTPSAPERAISAPGPARASRAGPPQLPRTLVVSCVDLDAAPPVPATAGGGESPGSRGRTGGPGSSPARGQRGLRSPEVAATPHSVHSRAAASHEGSHHSGSPLLQRRHGKKGKKHSGMMAALRRKRADAEEKRLREVNRLPGLVLRSVAAIPILSGNATCFIWY